MKKATKIILIIILAILLIGGGIWIGQNWKSQDSDTEKEGSAPTAEIDQSSQEYTGDHETYNGQHNTATIDIPGFDIMNLKADSLTQSVNLYNPEQNNCYFKMTIIFNDGTKLWESQLVEPNKAIYEITLNQTLSAGIYENCTLKYECFEMDAAQSPLNGSEIKFTMNVME